MSECYSFAFSLLLLSLCSAYSHCKDNCSNGTCCEIHSGQFHCCPFTNGVCCLSDVCCPQGSRCNSDGMTCSYPNGITLPANETHLVKGTSSSTTLVSESSPVVCPDSISSCPKNSTCCAMGEDSWGCCNTPNAVCCNDGLHCCSKGTKCNNEHASCDPVDDSASELIETNSLFWPTLGQPFYTSEKQPHLSTVGSSSLNKMAYSGVVCNGSFECPSQTTCCRDAKDDFSCCPLPNAVCCSDGQHCCPSGFKCDLSKQSCVTVSRPLSSVSKANQVICPDNKFMCDHGTTCCSRPNEEWGCCPFEKAICCSDMNHCCPENTTCDPVGKRCLKSSDSTNALPFTLITPRLDQSKVENVCPSGLVSCPEGTCCKNVFGIDACCPHPDAVCCGNGNCCPKGNTCDDVNGRCLPTESSDVSVPWANKLTVHSTSENSKTLDKSKDHFCPDGLSFCDGNHTCCRLVDDSFGCCPFDNGTCCKDRLHCCPSGSECTNNGQCYRRLNVDLQRRIVKASKMIPVDKNDARVPSNVRLGDNSQASWCSSCSNNGFCCPNAAGIPNQKCCPIHGGTCCSDGEHCCPKGSVCVGNGECENKNAHVEESFAPFLVAPKRVGAPWLQFLHQIDPNSFDLPMPKLTHEAKLNPLFLINSYYQTNAHLFTVCPDRERFCSLTEICCLSNKSGFVCAPNTGVCCSIDSDSYCPQGSQCSEDGLMCVKQDTSVTN